MTWADMGSGADVGTQDLLDKSTSGNCQQDGKHLFRDAFVFVLGAGFAGVDCSVAPSHSAMPCEGLYCPPCGAAVRALSDGPGQPA